MWVDWWAGMEVCRGFSYPYDFTWGNLNNFKSIESFYKDHCDITLKNDFTGVKKCILWLFASSKIALTAKQSRQFGWYFQFSSLWSAKWFRQTSIFRRQNFSFKFWGGKSQRTWSFEKATLRFTHPLARVVWSCGRAPSTLIVLLCCVLWRLTFYRSLNEQKVQF